MVAGLGPGGMVRVEAIVMRAWHVVALLAVALGACVSVFLMTGSEPADSQLAGSATGGSAGAAESEHGSPPSAPPEQADSHEGASQLRDGLVRRVRAPVRGSASSSRPDAERGMRVGPSARIARSAKVLAQRCLVKVSEPNVIGAPDWRNVTKDRPQSEVWSFLANRPHRRGPRSSMTAQP
jgi:hypothetical protein